MSKCKGNLLNQSLKSHSPGPKCQEPALTSYLVFRSVDAGKSHSCRRVCDPAMPGTTPLPGTSRLGALIGMDAYSTRGLAPDDFIHREGPLRTLECNAARRPAARRKNQAQAQCGIVGGWKLGSFPDGATPKPKVAGIRCRAYARLSHVDGIDLNPTLYYDAEHLNADGARALSQIIAPLIADLAHGHRPEPCVLR